MGPEIYNATDETLGRKLQELFDEGHDEVEIMHPVDGPKVITRAEFYRHLKEIDQWKGMSPAERFMEKKRIQRAKTTKQIRFRTAMIDADVYTVDLEGDENFGKDVDGNQIPLDGMTLLRVQEYPGGIELKDNEICCFVDENSKKPPLRIVAAQPVSPAGGGANNTGS